MSSYKIGLFNKNDPSYLYLLVAVKHEDSTAIQMVIQQTKTSVELPIIGSPPESLHFFELSKTLQKLMNNPLSLCL